MANPVNAEKGFQKSQTFVVQNRQKTYNALVTIAKVVLTLYGVNVNSMRKHYMACEEQLWMIPAVSASSDLTTSFL